MRTTTQVDDEVLSSHSEVGDSVTKRHGLAWGKAGVGATALVVAMLSFPVMAGAQGQPIIERIEPMAGPPGTRVQIIGRGFRHDLRTLFNEHEVTVIDRLPDRVTV